MGRQAEIPLPARRPQITELAEVAVVVQQGTQYLLMQRLPGERWAGLWDFLRFDEREAVDEGLPGYLRRRFGLETAGHVDFLRLTHGVTRYRIGLRGVHCEWRGGTAREESRPFQWVSLEALAETALPVTGRKLADALAKTMAGPLRLQGDSLGKTSRKRSRGR
jgi:A/G-specific adenine glycosylase